MRPELIPTVTVAVRISGQVKPVTSPFLAVVWRLQQALDQPLVRIGAIVRHEGGDLLRRGRETDEIQTHTADERQSLCLECRLHVFRFEPGEHEVVNRALSPMRSSVDGTAGLTTG